jgi:hypothetical protein
MTMLLIYGGSSSRSSNDGVEEEDCTEEEVEDVVVWWASFLGGGVVATVRTTKSSSPKIPLPKALFYFPFSTAKGDTTVVGPSRSREEWVSSTPSIFATVAAGPAVASIRGVAAIAAQPAIEGGLDGPTRTKARSAGAPSPNEDAAKWRYCGSRRPWQDRDRRRLSQANNDILKSSTASFWRDPKNNATKELIFISHEQKLPRTVSDHAAENAVAAGDHQDHQGGDYQENAAEATSTTTPAPKNYRHSKKQQEAVDPHSGRPPLHGSLPTIQTSRR